MKLKATSIFWVLVLSVCHRHALADGFLLSNGVFTTINAPGAIAGSTVAQGINNSGQIVGSFADSRGQHGFVYTNGVFSTVDFPGAALTEALGINDAGQIVGLFATSSGSPQAFLDDKGNFSPIDGLSGRSVASGINNAGVIVGSMGLSETGFIDANGDITTIGLPFSNILFSEGHGINDSSQVVGVYFTSSAPVAHGFLGTQGVFTSIDIPGVQGTYSSGINNSGEIVGFFTRIVGATQYSHGYKQKDGSFRTINVPGGMNTRANGINDAGDIVGSFLPAACHGPIITGASATPNVLSPPNHQFVLVTIDYSVADDCYAGEMCRLSVSVADAGGGKHRGSFIVLDDHTVELRAARNPQGNGRVYTIQISCRDKVPLSSSVNVTVTVPRDPGQ